MTAAAVTSVAAAVAVVPGQLTSWSAGRLAHGVQGRAETPIPLSAFFATAAVVVVVSFVGLRVAWHRPRWEQLAWRPLPERFNAVILGRGTVLLLRALVLAALVGVFTAAAVGSELLNHNIAPVTVFVLWWVGLVPVSLLLGNLWRHLNPWATLARLTGAPPDTGRYPPRWGVWPSAGLMLVWAWLELIYPTAGEVRVLAAVIAGYTVLTVAAMHQFGVETWLDRGEVFSVFAGLLATLSPVQCRLEQTSAGATGNAVTEPQRYAEGGSTVAVQALSSGAAPAPGARLRLGLRAPLVGATRMPEPLGIAGFIGVLLGTVTFDGFSGTGVWKARDVAATDRLIGLGLPDFEAGLVVATLGLLVTVSLVTGVFEAASWAADRVGGLSRALTTSRVASTFAHSLVPIAAGYHVAHYFTLFVFQSQDLVRLASDPLGRGSDLFGTADHRIDFTAVSPNAIWAVQIAAIVVAHVLGLVLAHERALTLTGHSRTAARSQYPMLLLMVALTVGGLWFLSEGMTA